MALYDRLLSQWPLVANSNDVMPAARNGSDTAITYDGGGAEVNGGTSKITLPNLHIPLSNLAFVAWVKTSASGDRVILSQWNTFAGDYVFALKDGCIKFYDYNGIFGFAPTAHSNTTCNDGEWHLVAFVIVGTTGTWYLDGVADGVSLSAGRFGYDATETPAIGWNQASNGQWFS